MISGSSAATDCTPNLKADTFNQSLSKCSEGLFAYKTGTSRESAGGISNLSPFTTESNQVLDQDMDQVDNFFAQFTLPDNSESLRGHKEQVGDRFIARRKLDFESAINYE